MFIEDDDVKTMLAFKEGEAEAFERLLSKYEGPIINFIYRFTRDQRQAEDLAQEVFLRVYKSAGAYVPSAKFSTWLYRIASNLSLDYIKKRKHRVIWGARPLSGLDENGKSIEMEDEALKTPEAAAEGAAEEKRVNSALSELPDKQRIALTLRVYEDKSYSEISGILGCSTAAVESLIFRARQNLLKNLKPGE